MSQSYRAILDGNRVEWIDQPPAVEGPVLVEIAILRRITAEERRARVPPVQALPQREEASRTTPIADPAAGDSEREG